MTATEIKTHLHARIEQLSESQLKQLRKLVNENFPEGKVTQKPKKKRKLGTMPGLVKYMAPDFNEPLEDFKDYMPE